MYVDFVGRTRTPHPDFGPPPYGMPYLGVGGAEARRSVAFVEYAGESDEGFRGERGYPIPELAKSQPNVIEGGVPGGGGTGDRHLLIVDRDKWLLYELRGAVELRALCQWGRASASRHPRLCRDIQLRYRTSFARCRRTASSWLTTEAICT